MSATLGNGTIIFGDGSTQTTKTPTVISSFTNDSGYVANTTLSGAYAQITNSLYSVSGYSPSGGGFQLYWYNQAGSLIGSGGYNCNCNCNC